MNSALAYLAISLTNFCPVGCDFCFMKPETNRRKEIRVSDKIVDNTVQFLRSQNAEVLSIGGGEPLYHLNTIAELCEMARAKEIEIFTSGLHTPTVEHATRVLSTFYERCVAGNKTFPGKKISLRLSVDDFHRTVPQENIDAIINAWVMLPTSTQNVVQLSLKTIRSVSNGVSRLARRRDESLRSHNGQPSSLVHQSGILIPILSSSVKQQPYHIKLETDLGDFDRDINLEIDETSHSSGVKLSVSYDGRISLHEYLVDNLHLGNAADIRDLYAAMRQAAFDTNYRLAQNGKLRSIIEAACALDMNVVARGLKANNKYVIIGDIHSNVALNAATKIKLSPHENDPLWKREIPVRLRSPVHLEMFSRVVVEVTNYCPVGCDFCWMNANPIKESSVKISAATIKFLGELSNRHPLEQLDITGGEPMAEPLLVAKLLQGVEAAVYTISTSGYFANTEESATRSLLAISKIFIGARFADQSSKLEWRLSVDPFHWHVSKRIFLNFLKAYQALPTEWRERITMEIRTVSCEKNETYSFLLTQGASVVQLQTAHHTLPVYACSWDGINFRLVEQELRMTSKHLADGKNWSHTSTAQNRVLSEKFIVGGEDNGGGYIFIDENGCISLHAFLSKGMPLVKTSHPEAIDILHDLYACDPLIVALRRDGMSRILDIIKQLNTGIIERAEAANNMYLALEDALANDDVSIALYSQLASTSEKDAR